MILALLNSVLFALRLITFATILCLFTCIIFLLSFLVVSSQKTKQIDNTPKPILTLTPAEKRRHNSTNKIINNVLKTPVLKPIKADKKQQTKSTKSPSKALKKQPRKSTKLPTQQTSKSLIDMTSKELLAYAKKEKIRGYSSVYKTQKKLGLIKLIEQQPEFSE